MIFGSVCSGIEAASVAWGPLGWRAGWLAEIEAFPSAVLAHHYPDVPNVGDMMQIAELVRLGWVVAPDVFVGGTPCQAFSVAGLRGSLTDARGALTLEYIRILDEIDRKRESEGKPAAVAVWENVPGVLTTPDNAFGCFLAGLAGCLEPLTVPGGKWGRAGLIVGPARTVAWRILDAQFFGVAQRRRRVFVVASARDEIDLGSVLFESEGVRRDIAPSRSAGTDVAGFTESRFASYREGFGSLRASGGTLGAGSENLVVFDAYQHHGWRESDTVGTLTANLARGVCGDSPLVARGMQVRRLTPTECERLQGFPDGYTLVPAKVKPAADGPRYKALGNSMAVPVMAWIGARIAEALKCQ